MRLCCLLCVCVCVCVMFYMCDHFAALLLRKHKPFGLSLVLFSFLWFFFFCVHLFLFSVFMLLSSSYSVFKYTNKFHFLFVALCASFHVKYRLQKQKWLFSEDLLHKSTVSEGNTFWRGLANQLVCQWINIINLPLCVCSACLGRAGCVALASGSAGSGHARLREAWGGADPHRKTSGGSAASLPAGQTGRAEDHPDQQGEKSFLKLLAV